MTHCRLAVEMCRACWACGRAMFTMDASSTIISWQIATTPRTIQRRGSAATEALLLRSRDTDIDRLLGERKRGLMPGTVRQEVDGDRPGSSGARLDEQREQDVVDETSLDGGYRGLAGHQRGHEHLGEGQLDHLRAVDGPQRFAAVGGPAQHGGADLAAAPGGLLLEQLPQDFVAADSLKQAEEQG